MAKYISPFAPEKFPQLPPIDGVEFATGAAVIRYRGRDDLLFMIFPDGAQVAGVFTKNQMPGAPIDWCRKILPRGVAKALVVNAGISNVFTGKAGYDVVVKTAEKAAEIVGCSPEEVFISSTGVIGIPIPVERIETALPTLYAKRGEQNWELAARAIATTDTFPKGVTRTAEIGGVKVTLNGFIKGSGMVAPDMATMLGYVVTDAHIPSAILQQFLSESVETTFNCSTVDSDTSTSDTVLVFATGKAKHAKISSASDAAAQNFKAALHDLLLELTHLVIKDGEGISKFVTIKVEGAATDISARTIGLAIANSPLVKTALAASDANWGRIVAAIGKAGEKADRDKTNIWIGSAHVAKDGFLHPDYIESPTAQYMKNKEIEIRVDVGVGKGHATVWTCDLTHEYVSINADYRS